MLPVSHTLSGVPVRFDAPAYAGPRRRPQIRPLALQEAEARRERLLRPILRPILRPLRAARTLLAPWLPGVAPAPRLTR